jgi:hypothetical protein
VEAMDCAVGIKGLSLSSELHGDLLGWPVVFHIEGDPLALHAWHKGMTAGVPFEVTILIIKHGGGRASALLSIVLNLEEGEGSVGCSWDEDLS